MNPSNLLAATVHQSRNLWDPNNNTSAQVPSNQYRQLSITEQPRLKVRSYFFCVKDFVKELEPHSAASEEVAQHSLKSSLT